MFFLVYNLTMKRLILLIAALSLTASCSTLERRTGLGSSLIAVKLYANGVVLMNADAYAELRDEVNGNIIKPVFTKDKYSFFRVPQGKYRIHAAEVPHTLKIDFYKIGNVITIPPDVVCFFGTYELLITSMVPLTMDYKAAPEAEVKADFEKMKQILKETRTGWEHMKPVYVKNLLP